MLTPRDKSPFRKLGYYTGRLLPKCVREKTGDDALYGCTLLCASATTLGSLPLAYMVIPPATLIWAASRITNQADVYLSEHNGTLEDFFLKQ